MYYVLDFRAYYKMYYNKSQPVRETGTQHLSFFQFESSLNLSAYGKNEKGEYKNIALSGLFPNYTLSSITVTDPNWMNNHYSYMVESNPAMYLKLLLDYKPFDQLQIVDPTIATAKKNLDKFAGRLYLKKIQRFLCSWKPERGLLGSDTRVFLADRNQPLFVVAQKKSGKSMDRFIVRAVHAATKPKSIS